MRRTNGNSIPPEVNLRVLPSRRRRASDGVERFRLKVWDKASGTIAYDNQMDAADRADPSTVLGGGSVVVHKKYYHPIFR
jgi:hypothetical protein